jgi:hypothetical protein
MESSSALVEEPPPLGRLVLRGNVGVVAGGGWGHSPWEMNEVLELLKV